MRFRRRFTYIGTAIFILTGIVYYLLNGNLIREEKGFGENEAVVVSVYDGDTIKIKYDGRTESLRFIGIDAPEIDQQQWGIKARERLYSITPPGSVVILEFDITKRDKYGRLLAYVFTSDGRFVNEIMLREGLALLYTFPPNVKYTEKFREAQRYARENRLGIWGENGLSMSPQDFRKNQKR